MNSPAHSTCPPGSTRESLCLLRFALKRRRRGKIAALPEATRSQIHLMLEDGLPYDQIISRLGDAGKALSKHALSRWFKSCHVDWRQDSLLPQADPRRNPALSGLARLLLESDSRVVAVELHRNPAKVAPLVKAIANLVIASCGPGPAAAPPKWRPAKAAS